MTKIQYMYVYSYIIDIRDTPNVLFDTGANMLGDTMRYHGWPSCKLPGTLSWWCIRIQDLHFMWRFYRAGNGHISSMKKWWLCPKIPKICMFIEKMMIKQWIEGYPGYPIFRQTHLTKMREQPTETSEWEVNSQPPTSHLPKASWCLGDPWSPFVDGLETHRM